VSAGYLGSKFTIKTMTKTQFTKFAIAGIIFAVVNVLILYVLTDFLGIYYIISSIIAFFLGSTGNFLLNKKWTFNERMRHDLSRKYIKAMSVNISAVVITIALLFILTEYLDVYYLLSQTIAMVVAFFVNFIGNKKIVFISQQI
jgi:dolichol-phosphate mannosyltransferase